MYELYLQNIPFRVVLTPSFSGIAVFFFLQFAVLTTQMFWVCELTHTEWKQIPGAICIVPPVVPISLVVSGSPLFLPSFVRFFINPTFSDVCFGYHLGRFPLDGMAKSLQSVYATSH